MNRMYQTCEWPLNTTSSANLTLTGFDFSLALFSGVIKDDFGPYSTSIMTNGIIMDMSDMSMTYYFNIHCRIALAWKNVSALTVTYLSMRNKVNREMSKCPETKLSVFPLYNPYKKGMVVVPCCRNDIRYWIISWDVIMVLNDYHIQIFTISW